MRFGKKILAIVLGITMVCTSVGVYEQSAKADSTKVRYEAEDADTFVQGSADNEYSIAESDNYSGGKAVGNMNTWPDNGRAYCETKVNVEEAGTYKMTVAYGGGEANHPCNIDVRVNEGEWISTLAQPTSSWDVVGTISVNVELNAGENIIDVTGACNIWYSDMGWEWVNIDYFELEKIDGAKTSFTAKSMVDNGQMRMMGRTLVENDAQTMDFSCSGFQFEFTGQGNIEANFTADQASRMIVDINGEIHTVMIQAGTADVTIAEGLEQGTYIVKAYKVTEAAGYLTQLNSIGYYDSAAVFKATQTSDLKFEFVGDSITCGNQINSDSGDEDGYYAFPSILSRAYGADWNTISCSGRGLMEGYNSEEGWAGSQQNQLKDIFKYQSWFRDKETAYDYSYQPDVLVMGVGSNDLGEAIMSQFGTTMDDFCNVVVETAKEIRAKYPNTYILWCYGTYLNNSNAQQYADAVASVGDDNMGFIEFPQMVGGKDGHPNYVQHERIAKILSENIAAKLGIENPMAADQHYELEDGTITANGTNATVKEEEWITVYSANKYIGDMNTTAEHPSNAGYVTVPVNVDKAGNYKVTVTYGSSAEINPVMAVRSNDYEWAQITGTVGSDWNATRTFDTTAYLKSGENAISVTGAINGSWANLDCIDIEFLEEAEEPGKGTEPDPTEPIETTTPEGGTVLPGTIRYEAEDADSFETGAVGSEHTIAESDNYSNGKAVGNMNAWAEDGRAYLSKKVSVDVAGTYQLTIGYAGSESGNEPTIDARVNGGKWKSVKASATPNWDQIGTVTLKFNLKAGENVIDITGACQVWYGDGQNGQWVNIDYFELAKVADEPNETTKAPQQTTQVPQTTKQQTTTKKQVKAPGKAKINKVKNLKGKKVKLTFKKVARAVGYQVKYATNKKLKKAKTKTTKKLTLTIKKLKKKKTYYFKVRAYVLDGKIRKYGAWSNVKRMKIKK